MSFDSKSNFLRMGYDFIKKHDICFELFVVMKYLS